MHKSLWFLSGIAFAVALAAAWMFLIAPHGRHRGGEQAYNGEPMTRAAMLEKQAARFAGFDADGDGSVSLAEWEAFHASRFDSADSNKDGTLSKDEMRAARKAMKAKGETES